MAETIEIKIEIPAPPEGWGEVEYRHVGPEDDDARYWDGTFWVATFGNETACQFPVARKLAPLWTPPPEFVAVIRPGWVAMDEGGYWFWHKKRPRLGNGEWIVVENSSCVDARILQNTIFPADLPWDKCCFKIGEPTE